MKGTTASRAVSIRTDPAKYVVATISVEIRHPQPNRTPAQFVSAAGARSKNGSSAYRSAVARQPPATPINPSPTMRHTAGTGGTRKDNVIKVLNAMQHA